MNKKLYIIPFLFGVTIGGYAQNKEIRQKIATSYVPSQNQELQEKVDYSREAIVKVAKEKKLPLEGKTIQGNTFKAIGIDGLGKIIYRTTFNSGSRITSHVNDIAPGGSLGLNLDGSGVVLGLWDGEVALNTHQEFVEGGVSRIGLKDTSNTTSADYIDNRSHGTHVAGTMGASGKTAMAKGMAPNATIVSYNWDRDTREMGIEARDNSLLVSNHSYGAPATDEYGNQIVDDDEFGAYDWYASMFDDITNSNPYYQPVIAAGNDGWSYPGIRPNQSKNGNELLLSTAVAKNSVVVAAVNQVNNYTGPTSVQLAQFSSPGPTNDFRIKPDISAKGVQVYSSDFVMVGNTTPNNRYGYKSGTSMAAPAVTGIIGLWQQWAMENRNMAYKSSTIRALMIHTADEAGPAPGPDHRFGWGVINAKAGVQILEASIKGGGVILSEETLTQGNIYEKQFSIAESGVDVFVTIAWNDPVGRVMESNYNEAYMLNNPILKNDLDLRIFKDGEEYFPWRLNKDFNNLIAIKGDNNVDNVEKIEIEGAEEGVYTIKVSHKGTLEGGRQDFSIIVSRSDFNNLSAEDFQNEEIEFNIWPNPVKDRLNISLPDAIDLSSVSIVVFDEKGKLIKDIRNVSENHLQVEMGGLASGVYIVKVKTGDIEKIERIMKK